MTIKKSFLVSGHTAKGFVNFIKTNVKNFKIVKILHPSYTYRTLLFKKIGEQLAKEREIEIILSAMGGQYIDGIIVRDRSLALLAEPIVPKSLEIWKTLDFTKKDVEGFTTQYEEMNRFIEEAYTYLAKGLSVHDDLEQIYINEMNFTKADALAENFIENLLMEVETKEGEPEVQRRLFSTMTLGESINIVPEILDSVSKRFFIKGRAGTGKSVFMNKVADACVAKGYDIELYHCTFDPDSVDMVVVRDLDVCLLDSTDPHNYSPTRPEDEIVDLYEETVLPGTDEKYAEGIKKVTEAYKKEVGEGSKRLKQAGNMFKEVEQTLEQTFTEEDVEVSFQEVMQNLT